MKNKHQRPQDPLFQEDWAQATYQTGSTQPPKSRGGLIAFLLVLVIFLGGISTALGLMNIRLAGELDALEATASAPVAFSRGETPEHAASEDIIPFPLGFWGQAVPTFWQSYHELPQGVYVVEVVEQSRARTQGLQPGDILTHIGTTAISGPEALSAALEDLQAGMSVTVTVFRDGGEQNIQLTLERD